MTDRRTLLKTLSLGAAALPALGGAASAAAQQAEPNGNAADIATAFGTGAELQPLPFDAAGLDGLSENLIMSHWENNYGGSVRALNTIKGRLDAALDDDAMPAFMYNDLKREHLMRMGSVILHELYFANMAPPGPRNGELDRVLTAAFGGAQRWEREFRRIGAGLGGGSGWVMLAWNHHTDTLENYWMADHMHTPAASTPLLLMDMYEHSYHMDYGAAAGRYIDAFLRNVHWEEVAVRFDMARSG